MKPEKEEKPEQPASDTQKPMTHEEMADQLAREMIESIKKLPPVH